MAYDRFAIQQYDADSGLQKNVKPFLIPDAAFQRLENAYVFRGRVRKRFGSTWMGESQLMSRLRILVGNTDAPAGVVPGVIFKVGQAFSIGDTFFTVYIDLPGPQPMLTTNPAITGTYDITTGAFVFVGAPPATPIYFYPAEPVMGLLSYENGVVNNEPTIGFDTQFAYQYFPTGWERLAGGVSIWQGDNSQFFWGANYSGANAADKLLFVTNDDETDPNFMRYWNGAIWTIFRPAITATDFLNNALILVSFKNRLLAFNTWEGALIAGQINYQNRCRYSQVGSPLDAAAWRQDIPGRGNAIDCPTTEAIVTVEFVKDRLIVFFERSTWELVYTGNQAYPFIWQQINTELGAESTFSIVPFDKVAIGVGNVGIMACNGTNVDRIDNSIPDEVFEIHNVDQGIFRVYGIRDYFVEMIYWTFPDDTRSNQLPFPNQVLVYNYKTGTWALNDDSITVFGYYQPTTGVTWDSNIITWNDEVSWDSGALDANFRQVIAGNQEGYTFIIDADTPVNAPVLQVTNITIGANNVLTITAYDHNMQTGDAVYFQDIVATGNLTLLNNAIFIITFGTTVNTFNIVYPMPTIIAGVYAGNGVISRVSKISIETKEYNFYADKGLNAYIEQVDMMVDHTGSHLTVDYFVDTSVAPLLQDSGPEGTGALLGTNALDCDQYDIYPYELLATRLWRTINLQASGECISLLITFSDAQLKDVNIRNSDFQLNSMIFKAMPVGRLQ